MKTFSGNFVFFFYIFFFEISRSRSQGISQFLFQPNVCKHLFCFEVPTVAGSRSFLRKVVQRSTNFHFYLLRNALTDANKLCCAAQLVETCLDIVICDTMLCCFVGSYVSMCVFIQSDIIAYCISDVACSMLHWCNRPLRQ